MKHLLVLIGVCLASQPSLAAEIEYRTGGAVFSKTWHAFYVEADHEPDIDDPLIEAGSAMVPAICEAIAHSNMARRRYAIGALGYIGDRRALEALRAILFNLREEDYFKGDALRAIYQIDRQVGTAYAKQFGNEGEYVGMVAAAITRNESWLTEPSEE